MSLPVWDIRLDVSMHDIAIVHDISAHDSKSRSKAGRTWASRILIVLLQWLTQTGRAL